MPRASGGTRRRIVAGPARALPERIAALDHEAVDDAVKDDAVVERRLLALAGRRVGPFLGALRQPDEIGDGLRRFLVEQPDGELAFGRIEFRVGSWLHVVSFVEVLDYRSSARLAAAGATKIFVDTTKLFVDTAVDPAEPKRSAHVPTDSETNDAELAILRVLWDRGPSTVRQVHDVLNRERPAAYTTALKLLQIMTEKGLVERDERDRTHIYRARLSEEQTQRQLIRDLVDRAFDGSASKLVMQALASRRATPDELREIRRAIDGARQESRPRRRSTASAGRAEMNATDALFHQPAAQAVGWALLHFVWQGAVVAALTPPPHVLVSTRQQGPLRFGCLELLRRHLLRPQLWRGLLLWQCCRRVHLSSC